MEKYTGRIYMGRGDYRKGTGPTGYERVSLLETVTAWLFYGFLYIIERAYDNIERRMNK
jgi:hypothetical protein